MNEMKVAMSRLEVALRAYQQPRRTYHACLWTPESSLPITAGRGLWWVVGLSSGAVRLWHARGYRI
eukprot:3985436-Prymnesium_polylepis.1